MRYFKNKLAKGNKVFILLKRILVFRKQFDTHMLKEKRKKCVIPEKPVPTPQSSIDWKCCLD